MWKGCGLAMLGAGLAYILAMLNVIDVGVFGPVAVALITTLVNVVNVEIKRRGYNKLEQ